MSRIRTVKPELFKHEALFDAEIESGLPLRLAFIGLFTACDREGRFRWAPRALKSDVLPFDEVDFSRILNELLTRGFLVRYACGTREYGCIPSWRKHQVVNNRERDSEIPAETSKGAQIQEVAHACPTRYGNCKGEGELEGELEGKGKGKGKPPNPKTFPATLSLSPAAKNGAANGKAPAKGGPTWELYSAAYVQHYQSDPVRNAKSNSLCAQLVTRLGAADAPQVAGWYVGHPDQTYQRSGHCLSLLVRDAEKLRTEWATGRRSTSIGARQGERTAANLSAYETVVAQLRAEGKLDE